MSIFLTLLGNGVTNPINTSEVLNSSKDDDNSQGNWSKFALKVIPNSYNFNPLSVMLISSIAIGIGYNSVDNCFLKNLMVTCDNALKMIQIYTCFIENVW